jgi:pilus assembly protein Flp/PilA
MRPALVWDFIRDEDGATAAEYAVMLVLIICAVIAAVNAVGNSTADGWRNNVDTIGNALNPAGS